MNKDTEQKVINHLQGYRDVCNRIKVLENYSVGAGITISRLNEDDHLQQLHAQLRGKPSYMYLSKREQDIMQAATANLERYPAGTRSQYAEVAHTHSTDALEERRLRELQQGVAKVIEARTGIVEGVEGVLERVSEYQNLKVEKEQVEAVLDVMREHNSNLVELLILRYVDGRERDQVAQKLAIAYKTFHRWNVKAIEEYAKLAGIVDLNTVTL